MRAWYREPRLMLAAIALATASGSAMWAASRALGQHRETVRSSPAATAFQLPSLGDGDSMPVALIARTVDRDLFHPERRRPRTQFRLPSEDAAAARPAEPVAPVAALRLLGTVVTPGRDAFAMGQLGADAPRVIRVGGTLGGFTLRRIEPGRAVFIAPNGETMDLRVSKAAP